MSSSRSTTRTSAPAFARYAAQVSPLCPPPMTIASCRMSPSPVRAGLLPYRMQIPVNRLVAGYRARIEAVVRTMRIGDVVEGQAVSEPVLDKPRVGVVGLGIMGSAMAAHLIAAGLHVTGYDTVQDKVDALVSGGGVGATSPAEVAGQSDIVVTSLATSDAVRAVVENSDGLAAGMQEGVVVDTCTMPLAVKEH